MHGKNKLLSFFNTINVKEEKTVFLIDYLTQTGKVNTLLSSKLKKFNEWAEKVDSLLERNDESALNYLPIACKWLRYWAEKLENEEPKNYAKIKEILPELLSKSASRLHLNYLSYLEKVKKHRRGTKVRLDEILRYAYYYKTYVHSNFIKSKKKEEARKILESFWDLHFNEIVEYRKLLDDQQILWMMQLAEQSEEVGIELDSQRFSKIEAEIGVRQESNLILLEQLEKDLETWENQLVEFRQKSTSDHELAKAIAGFATANPGRIYIGVRPDKTITGVEGIDTRTGMDRQQLRIARITKDIVKPPIRVEVLFIKTEPGIVLRIDVPKGEEPVYYVDFRPYTRDLSTTRKLEPSEVKNLYEQYFRARARNYVV